MKKLISILLLFGLLVSPADSALTATTLTIGTPAASSLAWGGEPTGGRVTETSSNGTTVITVTSAVPVGSTIIIVAGWVTPGTQVAGSVADSRSNTYTSRATNIADDNKLTLFTAYATTALQSGDTITLTWTNASFTYRALATFYVTGANSVGQPDASVSGNSPFSTSPTWPITTVATNTIAFCAMETGSGVTYSGTAWTQSGTSFAWPDGASQGIFAYKVLSSSGASDPAGTFSGNSAGQYVGVSLK